jgi:diamine N-acetyltransferase
MPPTNDAAVTLRDITEENVRSVMKLEVAPDQRNFVAPNSWSIAQHAYTTEAWLQAVYADEEPVGLVLLSERPSVPRFYLWRFMIDQHHQGRGYGAVAMQLVFDRVRSFPEGREIFLTYVPGDDGPRAFYAKLGFEDTGMIHEGEHEMQLRLV